MTVTKQIEFMIADFTSEFIRNQQLLYMLT